MSEDKRPTRVHLKHPLAEDTEINAVLPDRPEEIDEGPGAEAEVSLGEDVGA